jgi:hypothetical protein
MLDITVEEEDGSLTHIAGRPGWRSRLVEWRLDHQPFGSAWKLVGRAHRRGLLTVTPIEGRVTRLPDGSVSWPHGEPSGGHPGRCNSQLISYRDGEAA